MAKKEKDLNRELMEQFMRAFGLFHRFPRQNQHMGGFDGPYRGQGRVLAVLKMQPEITQKDLSYLLDIRSQSLGELLSKLEQKGYVTRTPSEKDRRVMVVKLTPEGTKAAEEIERDPNGEDGAHILDCLNDEEKKAMIEYLTRILASMEAHLKDAPEGTRLGRDGRRPKRPPLGNRKHAKEAHVMFMEHMERHGGMEGFDPKSDPRFHMFEQSFGGDPFSNYAENDETEEAPENP